MKYSIINKDILEALIDMEDNSFDAVLCDPPYEIAFMSKKWDGSGIAFKVETWSEILRVLKPGGHAFAFGGARTHHRLMVAMEDAGFELREVMMYAFGVGFPKNLDVGKAIDKAAGVEREVVGKYPSYRPNEHADTKYNGNLHTNGDITAPATEAAKLWDGYGSALKPAYEPCILARKPLTGTIANNCLEHGCGGLWIDGGRVEINDEKDEKHRNSAWSDHQKSTTFHGEKYKNMRGIVPPKGRFPANLILDSSPEVEDCFPHTKSGAIMPHHITRESENLCMSGKNYARQSQYSPSSSGSASRFFQHCDFTPEELEEYRCIYYTAKASQKERNAGLEERNVHPTVKPLSLCEYLAKLILPPVGRPQGPRRILVPFSGSGSEMIGAGIAGWDEVVGIEKEPEYVEIANARLAHWMNKEEQLSLF